MSSVPVKAKGGDGGRTGEALASNEVINCLILALKFPMFGPDSACSAAEISAASLH